MKLGIRIFAYYVVIFTICFYYPINWVHDTLRTRYLEGVEDPMVDQANILAEVIGPGLITGQIEPRVLYERFQAVYNRDPQAQIYKLLKSDIDTRILVADAAGCLVFDSADRSAWGHDFSDWRDVSLTLAGEYGARATLADPQDPYSTVLYVAAPIFVEDRLSGVLTVAKPTTNIKYFLENAKPRIIRVSTLSALAAMALAFLVSVWVTLPIARLTEYAVAIRKGHPAKFPALGNTEIGEMGQAFKKMQTALEGKQYVEQYVQNLTHEIKSPLSAIRGAAELLDEEMPRDRRKKFMANILSQTQRAQQIVDRMLELAALENLKNLKHQNKIMLATLVNTVMESKQPLIDQKQLDLSIDIDKKLSVTGDSLLLHQAVGNLIQNAIDFSSMGGRIGVHAMRQGRVVRIFVEDKGTAIPDYAKERVFHKFFSLQRPDSGSKSTGLGLNLVKEVALLHKGRVSIENRSTGGVRAMLELPLSNPH